MPMCTVISRGPRNFILDLTSDVAVNTKAGTRGKITDTHHNILFSLSFILTLSTWQLFDHFLREDQRDRTLPLPWLGPLADIAYPTQGSVGGLQVRINSIC